MMTKLPQVLINVKGVDRSRVSGDGRLPRPWRPPKRELGETGRVLLRPSGTEPVVRVMVEAGGPATAQGIAERLAQVVRTELALQLVGDEIVSRKAKQPASFEGGGLLCSPALRGRDFGTGVRRPYLAASFWFCACRASRISLSRAICGSSAASFFASCPIPSLPRCSLISWFIGATMTK